MRVIHLCFQLHFPLDLKKIGADISAYEEAFATANREIYQPFFALLERNTQKHPKLKASLMISGLWLELAEKYDRELIERLRKLVDQECVELIAEPYYHSLAFFYDQAELTEQVKMHQDKLETIFGRQSRIFALPELLYNDKIGAWAEGYGFVGMLVGGSSRALDWRSPNHVYEAMDCKYLRLLLRNAQLTDLVAHGRGDILVEKKSEDGAAKQVISIDKFEKQLELATLRGNLLNLYFDTTIFRERRSEGIIGFFDELFARWLSVSGNHFVSASQACVVETPKVALSIPVAVSARDDRRRDDAGQTPAVMADRAQVLPEFLRDETQVAANRQLYTLGRRVLASEDEKLIDEYRRLTAIDYALAMTKETLGDWEKYLRDLAWRVDEVKKTKIMEISKSFEKRREKPQQPEELKPVVADEDDTRVVVHFGGQRSGGTASRKVHVVAELSQTEVPVHRLSPKPAGDLGENAVEVKVKKSKKKGLRRVIRKLVIE